MRITGGEWRSRRLTGPRRGSKLRPTPDAMRERVFAVLGDQVVAVRFLDLYAGTGAVGLEALSRGAAEVVFVERHHAGRRLIRDNVETLGVAPERTRIESLAARRAVERLARAGEVFHIAWADPPFNDWQDGLAAVVESFSTGVLATDGTACLECPEHAGVAGSLPEELAIERDLKGGASRVVLIVRT